MQLEVAVDASVTVAGVAESAEGAVDFPGRISWRVYRVSCSTGGEQCVAHS